MTSSSISSSGSLVGSSACSDALLDNATSISTAHEAPVLSFYSEEEKKIKQIAVRAQKILADINSLCGQLFEPSELCPIKFGEIKRNANNNAAKSLDVRVISAIKDAKEEVENIGNIYKDVEHELQHKGFSLNRFFSKNGCEAKSAEFTNESIEQGASTTSTSYHVSSSSSRSNKEVVISIEEMLLDIQKVAKEVKEKLNWLRSKDPLYD